MRHHGVLKTKICLKWVSISPETPTPQNEESFIVRPICATPWCLKVRYMLKWVSIFPRNTSFTICRVVYFKGHGWINDNNKKNTHHMLVHQERVWDNYLIGPRDIWTKFWISILQLILVIDNWCIFRKMGIRWKSKDHTYDRSTLVQVMV